MAIIVETSKLNGKSLVGLEVDIIDGDMHNLPVGSRGVVDGYNGDDSAPYRIKGFLTTRPIQWLDRHQFKIVEDTIDVEGRKGIVLENTTFSGYHAYTVGTIVSMYLKSANVEGLPVEGLHVIGNSAGEERLVQQYLHFSQFELLPKDYVEETKAIEEPLLEDGSYVKITGGFYHRFVHGTICKILSSRTIEGVQRYTVEGKNNGGEEGYIAEIMVTNLTPISEKEALRQTNLNRSKAYIKEIEDILETASRELSKGNYEGGIPTIILTSIEGVIERAKTKS